MPASTGSSRPPAQGRQEVAVAAPTKFHLVTEWDFDAPVEVLWRILAAPETWPGFWPSVRRVDLIEPGDPDGIGSLRRMTWSTALPYDLVFDMRTTRIEPFSLIEGRASGELDGIGRWTLSPRGPGCHVRYDWIVAVTKPWMVRLAFLLRPAFAWNHGIIMERGRRGLLRQLRQPPSD
jgi:hypothetical protein